MSTSGNPNILLIIADDLGQDVVDITGTEGDRKIQVITQANGGATDIIGELPNLSLLLRNGRYFSQAWAQPVCSPTRASIFTGLHPWKNGIGNPGNPRLGNGRSFGTLPELLPSEYACGLFGKWHLGSQPGNSPTDHGWDKHVGTLDGIVDDYFEWLKYDSDDYDAPVRSYTYVTRDTVDEAMSWIHRLDDETPWFATIAFHTPHDPFQEPPDGFTEPSLVDPNDPEPEPPDSNSNDYNDYLFNLMAQNMDCHIGRLIGTVLPGVLAIDRQQLENTLIVFIGDNGSHRTIAIEEAKQTIYEGGVRVPMIFADGRAVAETIHEPEVLLGPALLEESKLNGTTSRMAHVVDLYETLIHMVDPTAALPKGEDSHSLISYLTNPGSQPPVRQYNFSQWFNLNPAQTQKQATIRNRDYKLNFIYDPNPDSDVSAQYQFYEYIDGEIPGSEAPDSIENLFPTVLAEIQDGFLNDKTDNLNQLLDELLANYQQDDSGEMFPDPR